LRVVSPASFSYALKLVLSNIGVVKRVEKQLGQEATGTAVPTTALPSTRSCVWRKSVERREESRGGEGEVAASTFRCG